MSMNKPAGGPGPGLDSALGKASGKGSESGGMTSSTNLDIGSKISLISNSNIRYEGILYSINTQESEIALQSVQSFGVPWPGH